jgi:hypothetical protein
LLVVEKENFKQIDTTIETFGVAEIRSLFKTHPELHTLQRKGFLYAAEMAMRLLLESGNTVEEAAKACGLTLFIARSQLKKHPDLQRLANQNQIVHCLDLVKPIFDLVQLGGISIGSACKELGVPLTSTVYKIARTPQAKARYPALGPTSFIKHRDGAGRS